MPFELIIGVMRVFFQGFFIFSEVIWRVWLSRVVFSLWTFCWFTRFSWWVIDCFAGLIVGFPRFFSWIFIVSWLHPWTSCCLFTVMRFSVSTYCPKSLVLTAEWYHIHRVSIKFFCSHQFSQYYMSTVFKCPQPSFLYCSNYFSSFQ